LSGNEKCRDDDASFLSDVIAVSARDLLEQPMGPQQSEPAHHQGTLAPEVGGEARAKTKDQRPKQPFAVAVRIRWIREIRVQAVEVPAPIE